MGKQTFLLQDLLDVPENLSKAKADLKDLILNDFNTRNTIGSIVVDGEEIEMSYGKILINLYLLSVFNDCGVHLTKNDLFLADALSGDALDEYFNKALNHVKADGIDFDIYRDNVTNALNECSDLSSYLGYMAGNTLDLLEFVELEINDEKAKQLFNTEIPYGMQYDEIESIFNAKSKELFNYFANHPETNISSFARAKSGLNAKQFCQCVSFVGLKPDFQGNVVPKCINSNFLHGLKSIEDYYIISSSARLALVTNYTQVRRSGYLTNKLLLLMLDRWHDNELEDCGTKHTVSYYISSKTKLNMIDGRNYYDYVDGNVDYENLKTIDTNDLSLIGKTIALRSPITCAGKKVCKTCYGKALSEINKNLNTGLIAVLEITERLTQTLLSAKHLLTTKTDKIDWGDDFIDNFVINLDSIYFSDNRIELSIPYPEEQDYDDYNEAYKVESFEIRNLDDKTCIHYTSPVPIYIDESIIPKEREDNASTFKIASETYSSSEPIFKFTPHNNAITKSLQNIIDLIESSEHLGITDYNELANKFVDLLIENGMTKINSIHCEMILSKLLTDAATDNPVDWSADTINPYKINRVSKIVLKSPISTALSFERLSGQLSSLDTYYKTENSIMDCMFK